MSSLNFWTFSSLRKLTVCEIKHPGLPITGIRISIEDQPQSDPECVSMCMAWSDFKQEMKKSMGKLWLSSWEIP